ncbi:AAA family ATPase [Flavobacterium notoginsengisoli]|uniref:AAA family ATPase n=1 Tax=Flavobacterium notoginsengisoli TaxID=1478199 RepID=UPI00362B91C2
MKIKSLHLRGIGQFEELNLKFAPYPEKLFNNTLIIGSNGAGKSTILESVAIGFSWFVSRIRSEKGAGMPISELKINNSFASGQITIITEHDNEEFEWTVSKAKRGKKTERPTRLEGLNRLVNQYKDRYSVDDKLSFPLLLFYDANRGVLDIPLKIRGKHTFEQMDGYDNALRGIVDYRRFFEWYREREDVENEKKIRVLESFKPGHNMDEVFRQLNKLSDIQLMAVKSALESFLPELKNFRVQRKPRLHMAVDKNGAPLNVEQLSQGEKLTMALVGDIARRLAIMNPSMENPLIGSGVVLIDEAELHLHPKWQRSLVGRLKDTFPNIQFIITTHSPLLISDEKDLLCYSLDFGRLAEIDPLYGEDVNNVLIKAMDTDIRNQEVELKIRSLMNAVQDKNLEDAKILLIELGMELPKDHIEMVKARLLIKRLQLQNESHN